ncbi:receptor-like protein 7 [Dendrobium catenatum]|uniref:receptor-like protein 7 n=1 Tax=Dendrobium catenatum TaxID=906689 RepID=UPI0010A07EED|nr:receptor-like protein 7 [Dendrobium catenatum]
MNSTKGRNHGPIICQRRRKEETRDKSRRCRDRSRRSVEKRTSETLDEAAKKRRGWRATAESSALLQLKRGFTFTDELNTWIPETNYCIWEGVTCDDQWRHVISLNLSDKHINGTIHPSLFNLTSLRTLVFSNNVFFGKSISDYGWERLANLSILVLHNAGFVGKIPVGLSRLTKLTSLDLSISSFEFHNLSFTVKPTYLRNMSNLRDLYLDNVDLSAYGNEWCSALVNFTLPLEVLSMSNCSLFGVFPKKILQLRNLRYLDISNNPMLYGSLPDFSLDNNFGSLILSDTNFFGNLPNTIGNLMFLRNLILSSCQFSGRLPSSIGNLSKLVILDLSNNSKLHGPIPSSLFQLSELSILFLALSILVKPWITGNYNKARCTGGYVKDVVGDRPHECKARAGGVGRGLEAQGTGTRCKVLVDAQDAEEGHRVLGN